MYYIRMYLVLSNENLELFQELMKNESLKDVHWVVLLNKRDLFREYLSCQSLQFCFGEEYDGRNYYDMHPYKTQYLKRVIEELILYMS